MYYSSCAAWWGEEGYHIMWVLGPCMSRLLLSTSGQQDRFCAVGEMDGAPRQTFSSLEGSVRDAVSKVSGVKR